MITRLIAIKGVGTAARQINRLCYCINNVANFWLIRSLQPHARRKVAESKRQYWTVVKLRTSHSNIRRMSRQRYCIVHPQWERVGNYRRRWQWWIYTSVCPQLQAIPHCNRHSEELHPSGMEDEIVHLHRLEDKSHGKRSQNRRQSTLDSFILHTYHAVCVNNEYPSVDWSFIQ